MFQLGCAFSLSLFSSPQQLCQLGHFNLYLNGVISLGYDEYVVSVRDGSLSAPLTLVIKSIVDGRLRTHKVSINFKASVAELKTAVEAVTGMPAGSQSLVYRAKLLRDQQTLNELGVHDGDDMSVMIR